MRLFKKEIQFATFDDRDSIAAMMKALLKIGFIEESSDFFAPMEMTIVNFTRGKEKTEIRIEGFGHASIVASPSVLRTLTEDIKMNNKPDMTTPRKLYDSI